MSIMFQNWKVRLTAYGDLKNELISNGTEESLFAEYGRGFDLKDYFMLYIVCRTYIIYSIVGLQNGQ